MGKKSKKEGIYVYCCCLVTQSCPTLCGSMNCSVPGFSASHYLPEFARTHVQRALMKVKEESEKISLTLNIQKTKIMAASPITSWQIDGETVETVADFIFLGSKTTADGD